MDELKDNTCPKCDGVADYFAQSDLSKEEKTEAAYYQGRSAPAEGVRFSWLKAFSDGCTAQFLCAVFFLFLSNFMILFGIGVVWHW